MTGVTILIGGQVNATIEQAAARARDAEAKAASRKRLKELSSGGVDGDGTFDLQIANEALLLLFLTDLTEVAAKAIFRGFCTLLFLYPFYIDLNPTSIYMYSRHNGVAKKISAQTEFSFCRSTIADAEVL